MESCQDRDVRTEGLLFGAAHVVADVIRGGLMVEPHKRNGRRWCWELYDTRKVLIERILFTNDFRDAREYCRFPSETPITVHLSLIGGISTRKIRRAKQANRLLQ